MIVNAHVHVSRSMNSLSIVVTVTSSLGGPNISWYALTVMVYDVPGDSPFSVVVTLVILLVVTWCVTRLLSLILLALITYPSTLSSDILGYDHWMVILVRVTLMTLTSVGDELGAVDQNECMYL